MNHMIWTLRRCAEIMIPAPTGSASGCSRAGLRRRRAGKGLRSLDEKFGFFQDLAAKTVQRIQNHTRRLVVTNHLRQEEGGHHSNACTDQVNRDLWLHTNKSKRTSGCSPVVLCFVLQFAFFTCCKWKTWKTCKPFSAFTCVFCFEPYS